MYAMLNFKFDVYYLGNIKNSKRIAAAAAEALFNLIE